MLLDTATEEDQGNIVDSDNACALQVFCVSSLEYMKFVDETSEGPPEVSILFNMFTCLTYSRLYG